MNHTVVMTVDPKLELLDRVIADIRDGVFPDYAVREYEALAEHIWNGDGTITVRLTQDQHALIDEDDFERVSKHKWFAIQSFSEYETVFYARAKIGGRAVSLHRFIFGLSGPHHYVDHINHDTLDCRKANLRSVDKFQSAQNRRVRARKNPAKYHSRFKGVFASISRAGKLLGWKSQIRHNNKRYHLGQFPTEEQAAEAYDKKAKELHGDFACLNSHCDQTSLHV